MLNSIFRVYSDTRICVRIIGNMQLHNLVTGIAFSLKVAYVFARNNILFFWQNACSNLNKLRIPCKIA